MRLDPLSSWMGAMVRVEVVVVVVVVVVGRIGVA